MSNEAFNLINDEIFLLSIAEYKKYKNIIPDIKTWWWLRSPGFAQDTATFVYHDGSVINLGGNVNLVYFSVRPALRISSEESSKLKIGEIFEKYCNNWINLGDNLAISEEEIGIEKFDDKSNDG